CVLPSARLGTQARIARAVLGKRIGSGTLREPQRWCGELVLYLSIELFRVAPAHRCSQEAGAGRALLTRRRPVAHRLASGRPVLLEVLDHGGRQLAPPQLILRILRERLLQGRLQAAARRKLEQGAASRKDV